MAPAYLSVVFISEEAQFVQSTMFSWSQNQAVGGETDNGAVVPVTRAEIATANSILAKVRGQITDPSKAPISFTKEEAQLMQYLYNKYLQGHGKPQGDLDWTYYIRFDTNTQQLIQNVLVKIGSSISISPGQIFPSSGPNPFVDL